MNQKVLILKLILVSVNALSVKDTSKPIVRTKVGTIRGVKATDGDYNMFMGIPYAQVNMTNPFGDSVPYPKFESIFEANNDSAQCVQIHYIHGLGGSLDCLQLNIYVPNNMPSKNLPVMAYIFGGSFIQGSFTRKYYGPRFIVKYGIILIIMNYRVSSYGNLCLDIPEVSGNQGLKDQNNALLWIHNNIKEFGGDPGKVTLFGHSSGATSVGLHILHAKEKLFHQAIIASGSAFHPGLESNPSHVLLLKLSKYFGFATDEVRDAHTLMSTVEPSQVVQAENKIGHKVSLCREKNIENISHFITEFPKDMIIKNDSVIPILIGNSVDEANYLFEKKDPQYFKEKDWIHIALKTVFNLNDEEYKSAYELISKFYADHAKMQVTKRKFTDFFSDFYFVYPNKRFIDKYLDKGSKIYYYVFPYSGGRNFMKNMKNLTNTVATHGDELGYIFDIRFPYMNKDTHNDYIVRDNFLTFLTNFAKYGDPTPVQTNLSPKWKPITNDTWYYMNIDLKPSLETKPFEKQMIFWDDFYRRFGHLEKS